MKPTRNSQPEKSVLSPLLAFGAHPDDIEFGCGGVIAGESAAGRAVHFVVCSRGEAASHGTPDIRAEEACRGAEALGASLEFIELDGDGKLEIRAAHAAALAAVIRRWQPGIVLAPSLVANQHPDHFRLGRLVRDAARVARYGGLADLKHLAPHTVDALLFYAVTAEAEPTVGQPIVVNVSAPPTLAAWKAAMDAHGSQSITRPYIELQLARARVWGLRAGVEYAQPLFPNDPLVFGSLGSVTSSTRRF